MQPKNEVRTLKRRKQPLFHLVFAPLIQLMEWGLVIAMNELLEQGLQLMALGMGVVFLFLSLLIGIITLTSRIIQKIEQNMPAPAGASTSNDETLREVMAAAVKQYRADHPRHK